MTGKYFVSSIVFDHPNSSNKLLSIKKITYRIKFVLQNLLIISLGICVLKLNFLLKHLVVVRADKSR